MLTQELLKQRLNYDPVTGIFTWRTSYSNRTKVGGIAGCINSQGYNVIRLNGVLYRSARLAWFYTYGVWPIEVDHKNTITADDSLDNLREATSQHNKANRGVNPASRSGYKGVFQNGKKFYAKITVKTRQIYLGTYNTVEEASAAYLKAAKEHFGEFANGG